jgi:hypothetical protein
MKSGVELGINLRMPSPTCALSVFYAMWSSITRRLAAFSAYRALLSLISVSLSELVIVCL